MSNQTFTPGDQKQSDDLNASQRNYDETFNSGVQNRAEYPDVARGLQDLENFSRDNAADVDQRVADREQNPDFIRSSYTGKNTKQKIEGKGRFQWKWKRDGPIAAIVGTLGIGGLIIFAIMPLKLNMFVENITKIASEVPGYAVERRTEYMMTRLLAVHLLKKAGGITGVDADVQAKMVFCKNASISCSLATTYGADYFDKQIKVTQGERFGNNVRLTVTPTGQTSLGGKAREWTVDIERDLGDGQLLRTTQTLQSNSEAKAYVKNMVNKNLKTKNITTRFLARAILMKKYGITHWRAFEKTSNKIEETRTKIKTAVLKNTIGKVSNKMSLYIGCLSNPDVCQSIKDGISTKANNLQEKIDNAKTDEERERYKQQKEALDKLAGNTPLSDEDLAGGVGKQIIIKRLLAVAGVAGAIGTIDMIFSAIEAVDNGALEQISADMAKVAYIGFAFGDETGIVPNAERLKAGDGNMEVYGELTSLLNDAEQSPLMQYENGLIKGSDVASRSYGRICNVDDQQTKVTLEKGQLVCPERTIVRDYSSLLTTNSSWQVLATTAKTWNNSIGIVIGAISGFIGDIPIISWIGDRISELSKPVMEWAMSLFFTPPPTGYETTGPNNYDALSGAIRSTQNELMEEGVSDDGKAYGAGGTILSTAQVSAITQEIRADEQADYNSQPLIARVFNPSLSGSFAQRFILQIPTSIMGFASLPSRSISTLATISTPSTSAFEATTVNPFGLPIYGYAVGDAAIQADPSSYTEAKCTESAKLRKDSYTREESRSTIPTYGVADPCALEKMVVGSMLQAQGVTDDPYSLREPGTVDEDNKQPTTGGLVGNMAYPLPKDSASVTSYPGHKGIDLTVAQGTPIYAVADGKVTEVNKNCTRQHGGKGDRCGNGWGNYVRILHADGTSTLYAHMYSAADVLVNNGDTVSAGQHIGNVGSTGSSTGFHLHFEVWQNGTRIGDQGSFEWLKKYNILPRDQDKIRYV